MTLNHRILLLMLAVVAYCAFVAGSKNLAATPMKADDVQGSVVLPPTLQTVLYMGDRYLAANIDSSRVLAIGGDTSSIYSDYYHRLHEGVSLLNPCHEDNFYIANALLAWAGGVDPALRILREATRCRFWDETPPFFLGYNLYFFKRENAAAKAMLDVAASRSSTNRAAYQQIGVMMQAAGFPNSASARSYLVAQREQSRDAKMREMLTRRIGRLDGLIALNDAQMKYEKQLGKPLENPQELIAKGFISAFPTDPTRLGYQFGDGSFSMREISMSDARKAKP
jgi:hypothetical protein